MSTVFAAIKLFGIGKSALFALIVIGALGTTYAIWHQTIWERGYDRALLDIGNQDKKALAKASDIRHSLLCGGDVGMRWDQQTGQCVRR
jgi:hypothetical protein